MAKGPKGDQNESMEAQGGVTQGDAAQGTGGDVQGGNVQGTGSGEGQVQGQVQGFSLGGIFGFFKRFGRLGKLLAGLTSLFTEAQLDFAIAQARAAVDKFTGGSNDNANRRTWLVFVLERELHLPPHLANLLAELAVTQLKHLEDEAFKKLDDVLVGSDATPVVDHPPSDQPPV